MRDAGVLQAEIDRYVTANGTLTGTTQQRIKRIISEKYIANFGVVLEPWTDYRRTGYPANILSPWLLAVIINCQGRFRLA